MYLISGYCVFISMYFLYLCIISVYFISVYSCHLFFISSASVRSLSFLSFIVTIFAWNIFFVSLIFLKRSLVFPILLFSSISLQWSLRKAFFSLLAILWNSAIRWVYLLFPPLPFTSLFSLLFVRPPQTTILPFCISFSWGLEKEMATHYSILSWKIPWMEEPGGLQSQGLKELDTTERLHFFFLFLGMVLITASHTMLSTFIQSSSGTLSIKSNPFNLFVTFSV